MRQWLSRLLSVVVACGLAAGCKQQTFLAKECFDEASSLMPAANIETDFSVGEQPLARSVKNPATLNDPDRPPRHLTLREAFALALENGSIADGSGVGTFNGGISAGAGGGSVNDNLPVFSTGTSFNAQSDRVKALALNPAMAGASLESSLSRFDATWVTAMNWSATDNIQQGLASFSNGNNAALSSSIVKGFSSGGAAAVSFNNNYRQLANPPVGTGAISPLYESRLEFGFEQPLWRDYGVDINQVLARLPSFGGTGSSAAAASAFNSRNNLGNTFGVGTEGILISRLRVDQQKAEFERRVHNMLLNVESAYWRLYQRYGELYSFEEVMRIAHKSWLTNHAKFVAGTIGPANYYPIRGQYEEFRGERMTALGNVLEAERSLRGIIGLPVEDGTRLVPIDSPTLAPYQPNWEASVQMALAQKPELAIARDNLRSNQFALVAQKNFLKPDLRFVGRYSPVGFGNRLDGDGTFGNRGLANDPNTDRTNNALRSLSSGDFADWTIGLTMAMPIGFRAEHAAVRFARLQLAQSYYVLQDAEDRTIRALAQDYQKITEWYNLIEARRAERKAYAESVEARFREFAVGKATVADFLLEAQRRLASAQVKEYQAIASYNIALAGFEYRKGNIMRHNNVVIAEGALPVCAEVRAVDHEQERAKAIVLRERPAPIRTPARLAGQVEDLPVRLEVPKDVPIVPTSNPADLMSNAGPAAKYGPGVVAVEAVDSMPAFRSVPQAGLAAPTTRPAATVAPPVAFVVPSNAPPSATTDEAAATIPPLRAMPRGN